jgi:phage host-nuclease inhibitor protein Gam
MVKAKVKAPAKKTVTKKKPTAIKRKEIVDIDFDFSKIGENVQKNADQIAKNVMANAKQIGDNVAANAERVGNNVKAYLNRRNS